MQKILLRLQLAEILLLHILPVLLQNIHKGNGDFLIRRLILTGLGEAQLVELIYILPQFPSGTDVRTPHV